MRNRLHLIALVGSLPLMLVAVQAAPRVAAAERASAPAAVVLPDNDAPVADAAKRGDLEAVRTLLRDGADVNAAQGDGMTALHWSALHGSVEMMDVLLMAGATTSAMTRLGGYTALHLASSNGNAGAVRRLLEAGSQADRPTSTGVRPLHLAAQAGSAGAITALLERGAEIEARDETHGRTPLIFAASRSRTEAMRALIAAGADVRATTKVIDYPDRSRADGADRQARERALDALGQSVAAGAGLDDPPDQGGGRAARGGRSGRGGFTGQAPSGRGGGGARGGGRGGNADPASQAQSFVMRGLSTTEQIGRQGGFTGLHYAARDGYADAALMLLDAGVDVNVRTADESTPMLVAVINGNFDLALHLLERGGDPNLTSDDGAAPLFATLNSVWALRTWYPQPTAHRQQKVSYLDFMKALLEAGADPNARTRAHIWYAAYNAGRMGVEFTGATAFWRAAYALDVEAMRLLVSYGADPHIPTVQVGAGRARPNDPSGVLPVPPGGPNVPPFHAASGVGYGTSRVAQQHRTVPDGWFPAARYFIEELGVDVNLRDADGYTALHHAAARGDNEMIMYLVEKGADVMAVARSGQTTVDMANSPEQRTQPFPETIKLLESMGAINNHNCQACK